MLINLHISRRQTLYSILSYSGIYWTANFLYYCLQNRLWILWLRKGKLFIWGCECHIYSDYYHRVKLRVPDVLSKNRSGTKIHKLYGSASIIRWGRNTWYKPHYTKFKICIFAFTHTWLHHLLIEYNFIQFNFAYFVNLVTLKGTSGC